MALETSALEIISVRVESDLATDPRLARLHSQEPMDHRWAESVAHQTKVASVRQGLLHCPASLALVDNRRPNQHLVSMAIVPTSGEGIARTSVAAISQTLVVAIARILAEEIVRTSVGLV